MPGLITDAIDARVLTLPHHAARIATTASCGMVCAHLTVYQVFDLAVGARLFASFVQHSPVIACGLLGVLDHACKRGEWAFVGCSRMTYFQVKTCGLSAPAGGHQAELLQAG